MAMIFGLVGAFLAMELRTHEEWRAEHSRSIATANANSAVAHAIANLIEGVEGDVGAPDNMINFSGGTYWADVTDNGDDTFTIEAHGSSQGQNFSIEAVAAPVGGGVFSNAVFAGNDSDDDNYVLEMGGVGGQGDVLTGDMYSGNDALLEDDASVSGMVRAAGIVYGTSGESHVTQPIPDLASMDYENSADFDVLQMFIDGSSYTYDNAGGYAYQLPEDSPGHIFRANPDNRTTECNSTTKHDFFLEDPYESVNSDSSQDGSNPYRVTLSGTSGQPGPESNEKVFFIDGNLWIHNKSSYSLQFYNSDNEPVNVTFVVKGNIYFADNLFYKNPTEDGAAFIAMRDESVTDSGNIYFGDPTFGTLQSMHSFMYAENNFYDSNLDASGSAQVLVNGIMTAGNQVDIERDYGSSHTKLTVNYDDRIEEGDLELPGLPPSITQSDPHYEILSWRPLPIP